MREPEKSETTMQLEIAQLGQPVLRQVAVEVPLDQIRKPPLQEFLAEMTETLNAAKGAGLAAPQVFASLRMFLAAVIPTENEGDRPNVETFINPKITPLTDETSRAWEGCLSFPELLVLVPRFRAVRIDYLNAQAEPCALELEGFPARVVQHEFDHLEGILTIDRAESTQHIIKASEIDDVIDSDEDS
jgi:peptide deformylase